MTALTGRRRSQGPTRHRHSCARPLDLTEPDGEPERQRLALVRVNLRFEIRNSRLACTRRERADRRPANPPRRLSPRTENSAMLQPPPRRRMRQQPDDLAIDLDQKRQTLGASPVRIEIRTRLGPPVELEQVVREKPPQLVAIVELCVTQRHGQGHDRTRNASHLPQVCSRTLPQATIAWWRRSGLPAPREFWSRTV